MSCTTDGPFCVLSLVDNHACRRLAYEVLDHSPTAADIARFLKGFKKQLDARGLKVCGITTDGPPLYPGPLALLFTGVPHQVCQSHVIQELTRSVPRAVAKVRTGLQATLPKSPRGRPAKARRRQTARAARGRRRIADLFDHRHLFVAHPLTPSQKRTLQRIARGLPHLRALRDIMDHVYGRFDRRCRTDAALGKPAHLRRRAKRFKAVGKTPDKLYSPNLQKALTFLDDKLLPPTPNAAERGNRRHRKMQKTVYRVRTRQSLQRRMPLDLLREMQAAGRSAATKASHRARTPRRFKAESAAASVTVL
jgi:hypothetical protein